MDVIEGYAAIKVQGGWVGVAKGNNYCETTRDTIKEALEDAKFMYQFVCLSE